MWSCTKSGPPLPAGQNIWSRAVPGLDLDVRLRDDVEVDVKVGNVLRHQQRAGRPEGSAADGVDLSEPDGRAVEQYSRGAVAEPRQDDVRPSVRGRFIEFGQRHIKCAARALDGVEERVLADAGQPRGASATQRELEDRIGRRILETLRRREHDGPAHQRRGTGRMSWARENHAHAVELKGRFRIAVADGRRGRGLDGLRDRGRTARERRRAGIHGLNVKDPLRAMRSSSSWRSRCRRAPPSPA